MPTHRSNSSSRHAAVAVTVGLCHLQPCDYPAIAGQFVCVICTPYRFGHFVDVWWAVVPQTEVVAALRAFLVIARHRWMVVIDPRSRLDVGCQRPRHHLSHMPTHSRPGTRRATCRKPQRTPRRRRRYLLRMRAPAALRLSGPQPLGDQAPDTASRIRRRAVKFHHRTGTHGMLLTQYRPQSQRQTLPPGRLRRCSISQKKSETGQRCGSGAMYTSGTGHPQQVREQQVRERNHLPPSRVVRTHRPPLPGLSVDRHGNRCLVTRLQLALARHFRAALIGVLAEESDVFVGRFRHRTPPQRRPRSTTAPAGPVTAPD
jgi:hypothetical protein